MALLVSDKSKECCCPPDLRACNSWLRNSDLGWKEENIWWMGMTNWRCRVGKRWLAGSSVCLLPHLLLDGPCCSLGLSCLHSALCFQSTGQNLFSNILIFKIHSPSIKKKKFCFGFFFFPPETYKLQHFSGKYFSYQGLFFVTFWETQIKILTYSFLNVTSFLSGYFLKALVSF